MPKYNTTECVCLCEGEQEIEAVNAMAEVYGISDQRLQELARNTATDPELQQLIRVRQSGWPRERFTVPTPIRSYIDIWDELVVADGIVLKGNRCIVPKSLRAEFIQWLHRSPLGVTGTLRRARESVYWPGMNSQLRDFIERCETCQAVKVKAQPNEPLVPHRRPHKHGQKWE